MRKNVGKKAALVTLLAVLVSLLAPLAAEARGIYFCSLLGNARFSPAHPGPKDLVRYRVSLPHGPQGLPADALALAKATLVAPSTLNIDVLIVEDGATVAGYKPVSMTYAVDTDFGVVGPLPVGMYQVVTDVRGKGPNGEYVSYCGAKVDTLTVLPQAAAVVKAPVVEYYHAALDHYFMTQDAKEIQDLDNGVHPGWARTGGSFLAYVADKSDKRGNTVCRWYGLPSAALDTHVFSASLVECDAIDTSPLTNGKWLKETFNAFEIPLPDTLTGVCPENTQPVYRLWNGRADSNHRYTTSSTFKQHMVAQGYVAEGFGPDAVGMCAPMQ